MNYFLANSGKGVDIVINLEAKQKCEVSIDVFCNDSKKEFSQRRDLIEGKRQIVMKVPCSPRNLVASINTNLPNNLKVTIVPNKLKTYDINLGAKQMEFIKFVEEFCKLFNEDKILPSDKIIKSASGQYRIVLLDKVLTKNGQWKGTPCQIGANSGIIEIDDSLFYLYNFSEQIALLSHEYAHFYENKRHGLEPENEVGADTYGLVLYLGAGHGETQYVNAFKKTFKRVDTQQNRDRIAKIKALALSINQGRIFGKPY